MVRPLLPFAIALTLACAADDTTEPGSGTAPEVDTSSTDTSSTDTSSTDADADGVPANLDCDDADAARFPGAVEICDGIDNDCDGVVDVHNVPLDYPTIQQAIDALPDGSEICLANGTYVESFDASDRVITLTGAAGAEATTFDLSIAQVPVVTAHDTTATTDVTLRGLTVTGMNALPDADLGLMGGFVDSIDGSVTLDDVVFEGNVVTALETERGGSTSLLYALGGSLTMTDIIVRDLSVRMIGDADELDFAELPGGWLRAERADVVVEGLEISALDLTTDPGLEYCSMGGAALFLSEGTATMTDVSLSDAGIDLRCNHYNSATGAFVLLHDLEATLGAWRIDGVHATLAASEGRSYGEGLVAMVDVNGRISDVALTSSDMVVSSDLDRATADGMLAVESSGSLRVEDIRCTNNVLDASQAVEGYAGGAGLSLTGTGIDAVRLDMRGNTALAATNASGGGLAVNGQGSLRHVIVAGNTVDAEELGIGGGMSVAGFSGSWTVSHVDAVGNAVFGSVEAHGGGIGLLFRDVAIDHANVSYNSVSGALTHGSAISLRTGASGTLTSSNVYDNLGATALTEPLTLGGNLALEPGHTDLAGDPTAWDLTLRADSPLVDAGDPSVLDADGTTADIGAYGGPLGDTW